MDDERGDSAEARGSGRRKVEAGNGVSGGRHDIGDTALGKGHGRCLHIPPRPWPGAAWEAKPILTPRHNQPHFS